jgi:DNA polymerase III psi subunit
VIVLRLIRLLGVAENVWTLQSPTTSHTTHMVLSFANATLTLAIRDDAVHEVGEAESNILTGVNTLLMVQLSPHDTLQVTPVSMRHIRTDGRVQAWQPPPRSRILLAAAQVRTHTSTQQDSVSTEAVFTIAGSSVCVGSVYGRTPAL